MILVRLVVNSKFKLTIVGNIGKAIVTVAMSTMERGFTWPDLQNMTTFER